MVKKALSRKEEYAEATRQALLDAALNLFIKKGYVKTSIEDIVRRARVTRGALYHHFSSKEEIFILLYKQLAGRMVDVIRAAMNQGDDPWARALAGCKAFLDYCVDPGFKSIRLSDAIGILGWQEWRALDSSYTMGLVTEMLQDLADAGEIAADSLPETADLLYALLVEASMTIVSAKQRPAARDGVYRVIEKMVLGLRI